MWYYIEAKIKAKHNVFFKQYDALVLCGIHIKMPDAVCDSKLLKKGIEQNREIIRQVDKKMEDIAKQIRREIYPREGLFLYLHMAGPFWTKTLVLQKDRRIH